MFRNKNLSELMVEDLPTIGRQKKLCYRTDYNEVIALYKLINKSVFNNKLEMPIIEVVPRCRKYWGICYGSHERSPGRRSYCKIRVMDKWFCKQWLITVLAHEMCHQYQWDIVGDNRLKKGKDRLMSHGPSFYIFREKLAKNNISLKRHHRTRKWFKTQNFFKS
jgi:hypothetical protein